MGLFSRKKKRKDNALQIQVGRNRNGYRSHQHDIYVDPVQQAFLLSAITANDAPVEREVESDNTDSTDTYDDSSSGYDYDSSSSYDSGTYDSGSSYDSGTYSSSYDSGSYDSGSSFDSGSSGGFE